LTISGRAFSYKGHSVWLHGENFENEPALTYAGGPDITRINVNDADYGRVSGWGGNHLRFGMDYAWYAANRTQFFATLDSHVALAKQHHLWIILSLVVPPGGSSGGFQQFALWGNAGNQRAIVNFWADVASHYVAEPTIAGYDLLNEPSPSSGAEWQAVAQEIQAAISARDANHFVVYEAPLSNGVLPLNGGNVVYSAHIYPDEGGTKYPSGLPSGAPLWVGEFGGQPGHATDVAFVAGEIARYRRDGVHWCHFVMREGPGSFGLYASPTAGDFSAPWQEMIDVVKAGMAGSVQP